MSISDGSLPPCVDIMGMRNIRCGMQPQFRSAMYMYIALELIMELPCTQSMFRASIYIVFIAVCSRLLLFDAKYPHTCWLHHF